MFHVELRQFPHSARAFNLSEEELRASILVPWAAGRPVQWSEREWTPDKTRLTIYEAPALRPDELGQGRGWANVQRAGADVTEALLSGARESASAGEPLAQLKRILLEQSGEGPQEVRESVALAGELWPGRSAGERLTLAERAVWELLHERRISLLRGDGEIGEGEWQPLLLAWETWTGETRLPLRIVARV